MNIKQINQIEDDAINCMLDNINIGFKEFIYCVGRINQTKNTTYNRIISAQKPEEISKAIDFFRAKVHFYKAFAVGKTKMATGELTED